MQTIHTAEALMASGQTEEGLKLLKALRAGGDDDTAFDTAEVYQKYGFLEEAEDVYRMLLKHYPNESELLLQYSELLIDQNKEDRAIELLERIDPLDENYLAAQLQLADLYQLEGLNEVAERKLLDALKAAPEEPVLITALGEFYLSTGDALKAADCLRKVKNRPELADQNLELKYAEALSLCGAFEQSIKAYRKGLKKEKTLDGLFGYAMTLIRIGQHKTAIRSLEELKALDPSYSTLYPLLAHAYEHEGMLDEALQTVEEGLHVDEFNDRLFHEAGQLAVKLHDTKKAGNYYQTLVMRDPDNLEALTRLVELKAQDEDYEGIIELLADREPEDPMLVWFLATAYNQTDEPGKAGKYYEACRTAFQDNPEFLQEYGEYLRETGRVSDSLRILKRAAQLSPENQDLADFVERLEQDNQE